MNVEKKSRLRAQTNNGVVFVTSESGDVSPALVVGDVQFAEEICKAINSYEEAQRVFAGLVLAAGGEMRIPKQIAMEMYDTDLVVETHLNYEDNSLIIRVYHGNQ